MSRPDSQFARNLRCRYCGEVNQAEEWPIKGDLVSFTYQKEPGIYNVKVHCPHCNKDWYVVWDAYPGPCARVKIPVYLTMIVTNPVEAVQYIKKMGGTVKIEGSTIWVPAYDVFTAYEVFPVYDKRERVAQKCKDCGEVGEVFFGTRCPKCLSKDLADVRNIYEFINIYKLGPDVYLYRSHGNIETKRQIADKKTMFKALSETYDLAIQLLARAAEEDFTRAEDYTRLIKEVELEKREAIDAFLHGEWVYKCARDKRKPRYKCNSCGWLQAEWAWHDAMASKGVISLGGSTECVNCGSTDLMDLWNPPTKEEEQTAAIKRLPERSKLVELIKECVELIKEWESVNAQYARAQEEKYFRRMEQIRKEIRALGEKLARDGGYDLMYRVFTSLERSWWQRIVARYWDGVVEQWRY